MKKRIAVLLALIIGFTYCPFGTVVLAVGDQEKNEGVEVSKEKASVIQENKEKNIVGIEKTAKEECEELSVEEKITMNEKDTEKIEDPFPNRVWKNFFGGEKEILGESSNKTQKAASKKIISQEASGLKNLQIPQKLDVVIDPWEIDKKGQVYSELYIISNTGDTPGILTLSNLTCRPREKSGVIVRTDKEGLHDSGDKSIYMEMLFGNGDQIVFSQESSHYQKELKPGEELSIRFAGEVNENAFGKWENNDIVVSVVYSWEREESADAVVEELEEKIPDDAEEIEEKNQLSSEREVLGEGRQNDDNLVESEKTDLNPEESETDVETEKSERQQPGADEADKKLSTDENETQELPLDVNEVQESPSDTEEIQELPSNVNAGVEIEQPEVVNNIGNSLLAGELVEGMQKFQIDENNFELFEREKDEIKNIGLLEPQKVDVVIDSWEINKKGQIVSQEYLLHNNGNTTGIWSLSELVCKSWEEGGVVIQKNKNDLHNEEGKSVYMELVLGNGKKMVLSQEKCQYKVELKPGETLSVCFVGEMNGNLFETREDGEITVTAVCTWELK